LSLTRPLIENFSRTDGTSSKPFPTGFKFKLFRNLKMAGEIEMGGKESKLIPTLSSFIGGDGGEDNDGDTMLVPFSFRN